MVCSMWYLVFLNAILATTYTVSKLVMEVAQPMVTVAFRMAGAGLLYLLWFVFFNKKNYQIRVQVLKHIALYGILSIFLGYTLDFWGLRYVYSVKMVIIYNITPFFTALFSYWYFNEKLNARKWFAMVLGFGALLPTLLTHDAEFMYGNILFFSLPEVAILLSSFTYSWGLMHMRIAVRQYQCPSALLNGGAMALGGLLAFFATPLFDFYPYVADTYLFCWYTLYMIIGANLVCFSGYALLMQRYSVTLITFAGFISTIFTFFFGSFFLGEPLRWSLLLSALGVFIGLCIFYFEELKQEMHL